MLGVTLFGLFFTPVFSVVARRFGGKEQAAAPPDHSGDGAARKAKLAQTDPGGAATMTAATNISRPYPLGAAVVDGGVHFSLFSRSASGVELLFFDREDDAAPSRTIRIDPAANRTYYYWHAFVPGTRPGQIYGYRVAGPSAAANGLRFDSTKVLLDPYGRGVAVPKNYSREAARRQGDNAGVAMKSVVVDPGAL